MLPISMKYWTKLYEQCKHVLREQTIFQETGTIKGKLFVFYGPINRILVMSVILSTQFLGRLPNRLTSTKSNTFASNWQLLYLNLR